MNKQIRLFQATNKDILIAFCETLGENEAKKAYIMLAEYYGVKKTRTRNYNADGVEDKDGLVRLRKSDLDKLLEMYGAEFVKGAMYVISDYIRYLEENKNVPKFRHKLAQLKTTSHFPLFKMDWVADKVKQLKIKSEGAVNPYKEDYSFYNIETKEQAIEYIKSIPSALRSDNPEVIFLLSKFPDIVIGQ